MIKAIFYGTFIVLASVGVQLLLEFLSKKKQYSVYSVDINFSKIIVIASDPDEACLSLKKLPFEVSIKKVQYEGPVSTYNFDQVTEWLDMRNPE